MAYIRIKTVKNIDYLYLVKSKWDPLLKTSTQQTIKYLGKASDITLESIPHEYRENPRILSAIRIKNQKSFKKNISNSRIKRTSFICLKKWRSRKNFKNS